MRSVFHGWVKNVYSLSVTTGTTSGVLSPVQLLSTTATHAVVGKQPVVRPIVPQFYELFSTPINRVFNLLNTIYTHNPQYLLIEPKKKI